MTLTRGAGPLILTYLAAAWAALALLAGNVAAATTVDRDIEKPVQAAINTRQAAQAAQEKWDEDQARLVAAYDRLQAENEQLTQIRDRLAGQASRLDAANAALEAEKEAALRVGTEMQPFLRTVLDRLTRLAATDSPFLIGERSGRLTKLAAILEDEQISVAEKYRKTMEALFIEAEYGNTIEVYQEKISLGPGQPGADPAAQSPGDPADGSDSDPGDNNGVLGDIFRLGRVSLFFLSLDREYAAVYNVAKGEWTALDPKETLAVEGACDMAAKHRPMAVINLPVGRLAPASGGSHDQQ